MFTLRTRRSMACVFLSALGALLACAALTACCSARAQSIPPQAQRYKLTLKREAHQVWGLDAPVASFAAQVHQESRWRADAHSTVGAQGLAQFMPATANWIGGLYPSLADRAPSNPTWALRALVTYDRWLYERVSAEDECEHFAFVLSAYNGGLGWVKKRQGLSSRPGICLGVTCAINPGVTAASQRENEQYPLVILRTFEPIYALWGPGACE